MKILHVFGRLSKGGAEMRTLDLMRNVDQKRYAFHYCALSGLPGGLDEEVRNLGGEIFFIKLGHKFPYNFRRLLQSNNFQIVHSHVHLASGFILRLAAKEGVPKRIAHFRSMHDGKKLTFCRQMRNRVLKGWINRYATDIVAVGEGAMRAAWSKQWQADPRCRVVYNGLDISRFNDSPQPKIVRREFGLPEDCTLFIHVGRMVPPKNHERVLSIFSEIASNQPNVGLLLVGGGDRTIENKLRQKVDILKLSQKVMFAGERSDVPRLLKSSDIMIFPSLWEGLPGAVLESCAAGTPVLASDLPGIREIADQFPIYVNCLPLNTADSEWALLVKKILKDREISKNIEKNTCLFENSIFNLDRCIKSICSIYDNNYCD